MGPSLPEVIEKLEAEIEEESEVDELVENQ